MLRIGLTGGIGSGKTTVARIFETIGIPVYYADQAAKRLMNEDPVVKESIIREFGSESYKDGVLNRKHIASIVFNDNGKLELLNAITHPATIQDAENWMQQQVTPYAVKEAALLFESGSASKLDIIIGVYAPAALRIRRVMDRDGISREEVQQRMNRQIDETIKMKLCDEVIVNDETHLLIPQVIALHQKFVQQDSTVTV